MSRFTQKMMLLKIRRIFQLLIVSLFTIFILYIYSSRSTKTNKTRARLLNNPYLPQEKLHKDIDDEIIINGRPTLPKYIHMDLKGAPPKADQFYEKFFNFLEKIQMGVKGVVMEYEDILPLEGNFANITHRKGYTKSDIKLILDSAKNHQLEIIPLIQTFGHLEWILKLPEYRSYRDDDHSPTTISPCLDATYVVLEDLLKQTLDMHPNSDKIHIGCDEVTLTNSHAQCQKTRMTPSERYIDHIRRIINIVHKIRPGIRILIWDDILRSDDFIRNDHLLNQLKGLVEPVSWNYFTEFDNRFRNLPAWSIYPKLFKNTWAASAFKGGIHRFSMKTNTTHHVLNNRRWLYFMESPTFEKDFFSAIILTGWSRFDHFMPLCDLLPTGYPSLLFSLHVLNTNKYLVDNSIYDCSQLLSLINKDTQLCELLPGLSIWSTILSYSQLLSRIQYKLKLLNTIAPDYNRKQLFVRRHELDSRLSELMILQNDLFRAKNALNQRFTALYSNDVIYEWLELYLTPIADQINNTLNEFAPIRDKLSWNRRPLT